MQVSSSVDHFWACCLRLKHSVTAQCCRLRNDYYWTIFFVQWGASNPEEKLKYDLHTPDVCARARPPNGMTCKRSKGVAVHYLRQTNMCKLTQVSTDRM